jgi:hypothetical protein
MLTGLSQNGMQSVRRFPGPSSQTERLPVDRQDLTHLGKHMERSKPVFLPMGKRVVRQADGKAGRRWWSKRKPTCNG